MSTGVPFTLPPHEGLLPKWLLFVSVISIANSVQAYSTLQFTQRVYNGVSYETPSTPNTSGARQGSVATSPVNRLSARTFGTWTVLSSLVRLYAAYHISNPQVYELALWSYGIAWLHFMTEWFYFGTARAGPGVAGPAIVSTLSLFWMGLQWGYYVK